MEDDGLPMRRRRLALIVVGAIIFILILLLIPGETVSYTKAEAAPEEQDLPVYDHPIEPVATSSDLIIEPEMAEIEPIQPDQPTDEPIPVYDAETERVLKAIAICESHDRQFDDDGSVLMNKWGSSATGRYQIMSSVWRPAAVSMGINIDTAAGNKRMAYYILTEAQGISAWTESATCLAKHNVFIN